MEFLPQAFLSLKNYKQFIVYQLNRQQNGKNEKIPLDYRTRLAGNPHNPNAWLDCDTALALAKKWGRDYEIGFVLTDNDPFFFLDIDGCINNTQTGWNEIATTLLTVFTGAAVEVSSSGTGLHILGTGKLEKHSCRNKDFSLELYTTKRFIALTGLQAMGNISHDCTSVLPWLIDNFFPYRENESGHEWTTEPCKEWRGNKDDDELLARMLRSSSGAIFRDGVQFHHLWNADAEQLTKSYPANKDDHLYDASAADAALAQRLAFWTGNDCERIRGFMLKSALKRDKWEREDYLPRTIQSACGRQKEWLCDKPPEKIILSINHSQEPLPKPMLVQGNTYLNIEQQIDHFTGCIYVADEHQILIPGGHLLNPERFKVMYGGYEFPMDLVNQRVIRNAWECFTESQAFRAPRADGLGFYPNLPYGKILDKESKRIVNGYWPIYTSCEDGDVTPFLNHLQLLFPDEIDRLILTSYLAATIQYKGVKFTWSPVIQGVQGNGKTFITQCIAHCIGDRYTHYAKAPEIDNRFNAFMAKNIIIAVEDIYVPDSRLQIYETLKPMITGEKQEIEAKHGEKITRDVCANFIINTNHKDGIRKTQDDRRYAPFFSAQQNVDDLRKSGMFGNYFPNLFQWAKNGGFSYIHYYLANFEIPNEYNPATQCRRAPLTSSTENAIAHGIGSIEQEILEAIAKDTPGFKQGWISSSAFEKLLYDIGAIRKIPQNKRRDVMKRIGYDYHPNLSEGRVNRVVMPDNVKCRLYIREQHPQRDLIGPENIAAAYEKAQK